MVMEQPQQPADLNAGFRLGEWEVEPLTNTLRRGGHPSHIEPKVMDVLLCLARHQGEVVSRDQLLAEVWDGLVVTEEVLTRCISELRTALGDTNRERRFIRTVPKRGYVLILPMEPVAVDSGVPAQQPSVTSAAPDKKPVRSGEKNLVNETFQILRLIISTLGKLSMFAITALATVAGLIVAATFLSVDELPSLEEGLRINITEAGESGAIEITRARDGSFELSTSVDQAIPPREDSPALPTIAVLPFVNLSGNPELDYFSSGLAEDIRNQLINTGGIQVAARTSSEVFRNQSIDVREIGRQLNVAALVEGTVRLNDERLRLTVQLTDASNGYPMWSERYEQTFDDVFEIQDQIANHVVAQLAPSLTPKRISGNTSMSSDVRAYDYYLLGRHHWNQRDAESIEKAIDYFQRALDRDENYALAYSGLADALILQVDYQNKNAPDSMIKDHTEAALKAQTYVDKAMALNPQLAEVHASQGLIYWVSEHLPEARSAYQEAVRLNPNYSMARMWLGNVLLELDQVTLANQHYEVALAVDPLHPSIQINYLQAKLLMGRYDEVTQNAQRFYKQTHAEQLLKVQMHTFLELGQYDKVLDFAVRHTFSEHYATYTTHILMQALIALDRFAEVEALIEQNPGQIDADDLSWFRAQQALVSREPAKLLMAAEQLERSKDPCDALYGSYYAGQAYLLKKDFPRALRHFRKGLNEIDQRLCWKNSIQQLAIYANYARGLQLAGKDTEAEEILAQGFLKWDKLAAGGRAGAEMMFTRATLEIVAGNTQRASELLQTMASRGWQPYGKVRQNPLYDGLQEQLFSGEQAFVEVAAVYEKMQEDCEDVKLTKFGL